MKQGWLLHPHFSSKSKESVHHTCRYKAHDYASLNKFENFFEILVLCENIQSYSLKSLAVICKSPNSTQARLFCHKTPHNFINHRYSSTLRSSCAYTQSQLHKGDAAVHSNYITVHRSVPLVDPKSATTVCKNMISQNKQEVSTAVSPGGREKIDQMFGMQK